jgi:hypothetical protein
VFNIQRAFASNGGLWLQCSFTCRKLSWHYCWMRFPPTSSGKKHTSKSKEVCFIISVPALYLPHYHPKLSFWCNTTRNVLSFREDPIPGGDRVWIFLIKIPHTRDDEAGMFKSW